MFSFIANKANKGVITCILSIIVIIAMLISTSSLALAQNVATSVSGDTPTETITVTPESSPEPQQTIEPTAVPTMEPSTEPGILPDETTDGLSNLILSAPEGWGAPVVLSQQPGTHVSDTLTDGEQQYLDLAVFNNGTDIATSFTVCLSIDGEQVQCWDAAGLKADEYFQVEDWLYTADRGNGSHYFEITADAGEMITEADETDNTWSYDFTWLPSEMDAQSAGSPLVNDIFNRPILSEMSEQSAEGSHLPGYTDTSAFMIGSVAVGVILPESTGNGENWTDSEQNQVSSEIQQGLNRWSNWSSSSGDDFNKDPVSANVNFVYEFNYLKPTTVEPIQLGSSDQCVWISQVLANMGFNNAGGCWYQVYDYLADLRSRNNTDWATAIFVVDSSVDTDGKFSDGYFGYAYLNGPMIVMTYDNDGWGIDRMDQVVQHEMGHMFGAGDNYYQAGYGGCTSTTTTYGYLGIPNSNCAYNNPNADQFVLMNNNTIDRNHWTAQYQVGWRDADNDMIADVVDTLPIFSKTVTDEPLNITGVFYDQPLTASAFYGTDVTINTITSARYRIDAGEWISISAADGAFDTDIEEVSFSLAGIGSEPHTLYIEGTNSRGNTNTSTFALNLPNDRMSTPTKMNLDTPYSAFTRWAGVTPDEPVNVCNTGDTRSVWYQFYAPTRGLYKLNAFGSGYSPNLTVVKKGTGTSYTPLVCGDTDTAKISTSSLSFDAAAGSTYLIGVSSASEENWDLSLSISKLTCPAGYLCGAAIGGDGKVIHQPSTSILDKSGNFLNIGFGDYSGFVSTYSNSTGYFSIITSGGNSLIVQNNIPAPGFYAPNAQGLPETRVKVLDAAGTEIAADSIAVVSATNNNIGGFLDGTSVGHPLSLYAAPGTYNLYAVADAAGLLVYQPGIPIVSSTNPGTVILDASSLPLDTFSLTINGITSGQSCYFSPDAYGLCLTGNTNRTLGFAAPEETRINNIFYLIYARDASNYEWTYNIGLSGNAEDGYIHGGFSHSFQVGGTLKVSPRLNNDPIRLDEGRGYIFSGVSDAYDHPVNFINFYGDSSYGASPENVQEASMSDSSLPTGDLENNRVLLRPHISAEAIQAQTWVNKSIGPSYSVSNPAAQVITTGSVGSVGSAFPVSFSNSSLAGTWTITETLDAGPMGGTVSGSKTFTVYSLLDHPLANDDFNNAAVIPPLLNSEPFTVTNLDVSGGTRASDDPLLPNEKTRGYATAWYKFVADHNGILSINTFDSDYDTFLSVWRGARGALVNVAYNNDYINPETETILQRSQVEVPVRLGQTYYIEVAQYPFAGSDNTSIQSLDVSSVSGSDVETQRVGGSLDLSASLQPCFSVRTPASPAIGGKVKISTAANCLGTQYIQGTAISVTAVPNARYAFSSWSNSVTLNPSGITVEADTTLTANFVYLTVPGMVSPASGFQTNDNTPTFTWNAAAGIQYEIQIDNSFYFTLPIEQKAVVTDPAYTAAAALTDGVKYWRVRSLGRYGEFGAWSAARSFRVDTAVPSAPVLKTPTDLSTVRGMPLFSWGIPAGANAFIFEFDIDSDFISPLQTSGILTTASYRPALELLGTFYWHVKARDTAGNWSVWSSLRTVTLIPPYTTAPALISPTSGAFVNTQTPELTWKRAPYGVEYQIQVSKSYTFNAASLVIDQRPVGGPSGFPSGDISGAGTDVKEQVAEILSFTTTVLPEGRYYWRVRAWNASHEPGAWSAYRIIRIDVTPQSVPVLKSPVNNGVVRTNRPVISATALMPGAKYTWFQVDDTSDFSSPIVDNRVAGAAYTLTSAQVLPFGTYYWRACTQDAAGNSSAWTAPRSFLVTILKTPANLSTTADSTPLFTWSTWPGALNYRIQVDDSELFDAPMLDVTRPVSYSLTSASVLGNGQYYWRMQVRTSSGWSTWTTPYPFTIAH